MHPSCMHAAIASDWLPYGYLGEFARVSASQESCGTMRKKLGGYGDFGGFGGGGGGRGLGDGCVRTPCTIARNAMRGFDMVSN